MEQDLAKLFVQNYSIDRKKRKNMQEEPNAPCVFHFLSKEWNLKKKTEEKKRKKVKTNWREQTNTKYKYKKKKEFTSPFLMSK